MVRASSQPEGLKVSVGYGVRWMAEACDLTLKPKSIKAIDTLHAIQDWGQISNTFSSLENSLSILNTMGNQLCSIVFYTLIR